MFIKKSETNEAFRKRKLWEEIKINKEIVSTNNYTLLLFSSQLWLDRITQITYLHTFLHNVTIMRFAICIYEDISKLAHFVQLYLIIHVVVGKIVRRPAVAFRNITTNMTAVKVHSQKWFHCLPRRRYMWHLSNLLSEKICWLVRCDTTQSEEINIVSNYNCWMNCVSVRNENNLWARKHTPSHFTYTIDFTLFRVELSSECYINI